MCKVLQLQRGSYYYEIKERLLEDELSSVIDDIFKESCQNYRRRKIKGELQKKV